MNNRGGKSIFLGLVIHNHQPVGQFDHVFGEVFEQAYEPLIAALERHPGVRLALHYTGSLLDWLRDERPDFMQALRHLVERGQVEILSGGYYEPILPSIPDDDKHSQIIKLTEAVRGDFGYEANGMWLAERVWEPTLPRYMNEAGIEWTIVDDIHFKMVGLREEDLIGYYVTEDTGKVIDVFGTSKMLRYTIPWRPVHETIEYARELASEKPGKILVMGDDGEKFGAWPDTLEHCWGHDGKSGWVDEFFSALEENKSWLHTVKLGEYVRHFPAVGRIYLPTASYNEMMEWALPAREAYEFTELYHRLEEADDPVVRFMKGGFWRNFMVKYPEVNTQHKKMLRVHDKVAEARRLLAERGQLDGSVDYGQEDLWRAQSNDTYWHGLFGGIYMTDVRTRVHAHLIRAENQAERITRGEGEWLATEITDLDRDSEHELLVEGSALNLYIDLAEGGSIFEWDVRGRNYDLASTMTRRPESYHETLRKAEAARRAGGARQDAAHSESGEPLSPHEAVRVKEPGLDRFLNYDRHRRNSMIEHFLGPGTTLEGFARSDYNEEGDFYNGAYQAEVDEGGEGTLHVALHRNGHVRVHGEDRPVRVTKRLTLHRGSPNFRVDYTIKNTGDQDLSTVLGSEWNLNLLGGGHNPTAYYRVRTEDGEEHPLKDAALDSTAEVRNVREVALGNSWLDIEMALKTNHEATLWRFPVETVSGSEAGFERTYQGSCVLLQWLITLPPGKSVEIELEWELRTQRDS